MTSSERIAALERQIEKLTAQINSFPVRFAGSGGAADSTFVMNIAVVTQSASSNGGPGKCKKLKSDLTVYPDSPELDFFCVHQYVPCPVGARIVLFTASVWSPGGLFDPPGYVDANFGMNIDAMTDLSTLNGFAPLKALVAGAGGPGGAYWDGANCDGT